MNPIAASPFYTMAAKSLRGEVVAFDRFRGKVVLIVNTASQCGFTPQYAGLEALHRRYADQGLVVLGFPCNQFGGQEPGEGESIAQQCQLHYGVSFPLFEKCEVKGPKALPLFQWLTSSLPGWLGRDIRWNFTKFLIDRDGTPVGRYAPVTRPERLDPKIRSLLGGLRRPLRDEQPPLSPP